MWNVDLPLSEIERRWVNEWRANTEDDPFWMQEVPVDIEFRDGLVQYLRWPSRSRRQSPMVGRWRVWTKSEPPPPAPAPPPRKFRRATAVDYTIVRGEEVRRGRFGLKHWPNEPVTGMKIEQQLQKMYVGWRVASWAIAAAT